MSQVQVPDVSEMTIRMDAISPEAEKELNELSWESQRAVMRLLIERPVIRSDCKRVQRLGDLRVYRMRVTRSVRLCFVCVQQVHCIVSFGSKHDFERFCNTFHGSFPNSFIPLSESTVMKKLISRSASVAGNGHKTTESSKPPAPSPDTSPIYQEAQRVGFALVELLETGMEGHQSKIDDDIVAHVQLMKDEVDKQLSSISESARGQTSATQKQLAEFNERITGMLKLIEDHSDALTGIAERIVASEQAETHRSQLHQAEIESVQQTTRRLTQRMDQLASRLGEVQKKAVGHQEQVMKYAELQATRVESMNNQQTASEARLAQLETQAAEHFCTVDARMDNHVNIVSALGERVGALETAVQLLEVEALRPQKLWQAARAWVHQRNEQLSAFFRQPLKGRRGPAGNQPSADSLAEMEP